MLFKVVLNMLAFFVVASLSSSLARRLQGSARQLAKTTQSLTELRMFNERVFDSVSSGLVTADLEGRIKTFNRAAEEITGLQFAAVYQTDLSCRQTGHFVNGLFKRKQMLIAHITAKNSRITAPATRM